jgi:thiol-disulfide isomerase/thioredoxin
MFLLLSSLSIVGKLTGNNFANFISEDQLIPVLVFINSAWCPHCKQFRPDWERLEDLFSENPRIILAQISMELDSRLCGRFPGSGTPRLLWIPAGLRSAERYSDPLNFESLLAFIRRKLSDRLPVIRDLDEFVQIESSLQTYSLFFLQEFPSSNATEQSLLRLSHSLANYPVRFFRLNFTQFSEQTDSLVYRWPRAGQTIHYNGSLSNATAIAAFTNLYSFPPISALTKLFIETAQTAERVLLLHPGPEWDTALEGEIFHLAAGWPPDLKGAIVDCEVDPAFCSLYSINSRKGAQLIIARPGESVYHRFQGDWTVAKIRRWIRQALHGEEVMFGPGVAEKST